MSLRREGTEVYITGQQPGEGEFVLIRVQAIQLPSTELDGRLDWAALAARELT